MKYTSFVFAIFFSVCGLSSVSAYGSYEKTQSAKGGQNIVYISSNGNDSQGDGTATSPFYSLNKALEGKLSSDGSADTLFVQVASGDYYMEAPLSIETPSSRPVVIKSQGKEKPRFMGGLCIKGWQKCENGLYKAYIPEVLRYGFNFEQFYVNGQRAILARTPNVDWFFVKSSKETPIVKGGSLANYAVQQIDFEYSDWESMKGLSRKELKNIKFRFYHKWDITRKNPKYVEVDSARIYMEGRGMKPWNQILKGSRYFMYDYKAALDMAGEWFLDRETGYLYYMPREGEDMNTAFCVAPVLHQWISVKGEPENPVKNIKFKGLSFQYSSYMVPFEGEEPMQAAAGTEAAIQFDFAENIIFEDCEMLHTGAYGISFGRECHQNRIEHCYIADLGAGGIKIGEPYLRATTRKVTSGNVINNNIVTDAGHEQPCGVGVALFHTSDNQVTHNDIFDILYSGVSVGWVWGYNEDSASPIPVLNEKGEMETVMMKKHSPSVHNIIMYNRIHHIGWGELSDMGAVYTLGEAEGTKVCNNVITDVLSYDYGGWGLYTDEGSTGVEMSNNLVLRCKSGGFHQHYGKNNKIENNILAFGFYHQVQLTRAEPHLSLHFKHNIILHDKGETLVRTWDKANVDMDYNLYWRTDSTPITMMDKSFAEWKKMKEPHSVMLDPLFKDVKNDDYTLVSRKNIRKIGFKPFNYSEAGVYGDKEWRKKALLSLQKLELFKKMASIRLQK